MNPQTENMLSEKNENNTTKESDEFWIFFDFSGTIVNTLKALANTYTRFVGKIFTQDKIRKMYKDMHQISTLRFFLKYKLNPFKFLFGGRKKFAEIRKEEYNQYARVFPGIPQVLRKLRQMTNVNLAVITYDTIIQDEDEREELFERFGIPIKFDSVITDEKDKAEALQEFLDKQSISDGLFVSDTHADIEIANKMNLKPIGVTWGLSTEEDFQTEYIVDDPRIMLQLIIRLIHQPNKP